MYNYTMSTKVHISIQNAIQPSATSTDVRAVIATHSKVKVWFRKLNGDIRQLNGTVDLTLIPTNKQPKGLKDVPHDQICLFDTDLKEWRSFNIKSLIQLEVA